VPRDAAEFPRVGSVWQDEAPDDLVTVVKVEPCTDPHGCGDAFVTLRCDDGSEWTTEWSWMQRHMTAQHCTIPSPDATAAGG
jgi:hypothetical protein